MIDLAESIQRDPIEVAHDIWPDLVLYKQQIEVIRSVWRDDETYVVAGNKLGKDFVAGLIVVLFFLTRQPCRIVTTSVKDDHLNVLWGEVGRFIQNASLPLSSKQGGPLELNHYSTGIRKISHGERCPLSYAKGIVASADTAESFQGHHIASTDNIPRTLLIGDEASSLRDIYYRMASTWANRMLIFGNPWSCENFFKWAVCGSPDGKDPGGDIPRPKKLGGGFYRKVIRIKAEDSPNVRLGIAQERRGEPITGEILVPGVKTYAEYLKNRKQWDPIQQCVCLDAQFHVGADSYLYPGEWLDKAAEYADRVGGIRPVTLGVDPGEGGDKTCWSVVGNEGLVTLVSKQTPDTMVVQDYTIGLIKDYNMDPRNVLFDRGGGGKEHADFLRRKGYDVRTVAFGEGVTPPKRIGMVTVDQRETESEARYAFRFRRDQMYGLLRNRLDPANGELFAIGKQYTELRRQLSLIPLVYDKEGRLSIPSKRRPPGAVKTARNPSLIEIIGHSPDEADSLVLGVYGLEELRTQVAIAPMF